MDAFKYGIGEPSRSLANTVLTKEDRPMLRNAMTRMNSQLMKEQFLKMYFKEEEKGRDPEAFAKVYVNAWPKLRLSRRLPRSLPSAKQSLPTIVERKRQRKQKTRKNRR
jgi:hypothetical protein